jgi:S-adenosylmethionine uptake transporter
VAKALSPHLSVFQITFVRYTGAVTWLALYIALTRSSWPNPHNWRRHVTRGVTIIITACLFFYAISHLQLAVVTALSMTAPVYVAIIGILFFKERPTPGLLMAIGFGIAGSLVIVFGDGILAFEGEVTAWIAVVSALVVLPFAVPGFTLPTSDVWWLMVLIGFLGATGFVLLTIGLRTTPASAFAIVDYMNILWAALFGYVFFTEVPELRFWIGGALIIAACVLGAWSARKRPETPIAP